MKRIRSHNKKNKRSRVYGITDDSLFLDRIKEGTLRVDVYKSMVESCLSGSGKGKWREIKQEESSDGYYLIRCYLNGKRRRTRVHRLVWIANSGLLIPEGFDIHHKDHDRKNNSIDNLEMVESYSHRVGHFDWNKDMDESDIVEGDLFNDWDIGGVPF